MKLYIMRHGETPWNEKHLIQGSADIELNDKGVQLAALTIEGLKKEGILFDQVFSSPYKRAYKTAEILADGFIPLETDDRLKEMSFGRYEGIPLDDIMKDPQYENMYNFFHHPEKYAKEEGCETYAEARERIESFYLDKIAPNISKWKSCLIVCHGAVIRTFMAYLLNREIGDLWDIRQPNCCMNIFDITEDNLEIVQEGRVYYEVVLKAGNKFL